MALPDVDIVQKNGTSGRGATGFDFMSGMIFYGTTPVVTGKWTQYPGPPVIKAQQVFSKTDITSAGVIPYSDNTASRGQFVINTQGATGATGEIKVTVPKANSTTEVISLGVYTVGVSDTTIALQGAAWAAVINAGTATHGWTATFTTATMTLIAPKSAGKSLNTGTPYASTLTGALAVTITQNTVLGTASEWAVWAYQMEEFFNKFPTGNIWVGVISASSSFDEIVTLQGVASNKLRQIGIQEIDATRSSAANIIGTITSINTAAVKLQKKSPLSIVYSPNIYSVADLSTYPDQNSNTAYKVQCVISQDGNAKGALLFVQNQISIGNMGAKLASIAKSRVSASDAQPIDDFNMSDGVENDTPAFANGVLLQNMSSNLQAQLDNYRYTFFRKFGDTVVGTYWTDNKCCVTSASDYAFVNDNRTSDKVSRICYSTLVPKLSSEIIFNSDGTLQNYAIESFTDLVTDAITANMITGYGVLPLISGVKVTIDPSQNVRATNTLVLDVTIVQNGIARNITVNIAYGTF